MSGLCANLGPTFTNAIGCPLMGRTPEWKNTVIYSKPKGKEADGWDRAWHTLHIVWQAITLGLTIGVMSVFYNTMKREPNCAESDKACFTENTTPSEEVMAVACLCCQLIGLVSMLILGTCLSDKYKSNTLVQNIVFFFYQFSFMCTIYLLGKAAYRWHSGAFWYFMSTTWIQSLNLIFTYSSHAAYGCVNIGNTFLFTLALTMDLFSAILIQTDEWPPGASALNPYPEKLTVAKTISWICCGIQFLGLIFRFCVRRLNQNPAKKMLRVSDLRGHIAFRIFILWFYLLAFLGNAYKFAVLDSFYKDESTAFAIPNILISFAVTSIVFFPPKKHSNDKKSISDEDAPLDQVIEEFDGGATETATAQPVASAYKQFSLGKDSVRVRLIP